MTTTTVLTITMPIPLAASDPVKRADPAAPCARRIPRNNTTAPFRRLLPTPPPRFSPDTCCTDVVWEPPARGRTRTHGRETARDGHTRARVTHGTHSTRTHTHAREARARARALGRTRSCAAAFSRRRVPGAPADGNSASPRSRNGMKTESGTTRRGRRRRQRPANERDPEEEENDPTVPFATSLTEYGGAHSYGGSGGVVRVDVRASVAAADRDRARDSPFVASSRRADRPANRRARYRSLSRQGARARVASSV